MSSLTVNKENTLVVIPTRGRSKRFPEGNKALVDMWGKPLIQRTWEQAMKAGIGDVVVVADNLEALQVIDNVGGMAMLIDADVTCGSDRSFIAARRFNAMTPKYTNVVNVQGDLAFFDPFVLQCVADNIRHGRHPNDRVTSVAVYPIRSDQEWWDENCTKVRVGQDGYALDFFRGDPFPDSRDQCFGHFGMYGFTMESLKTFNCTERSEREIAEGLEQLRCLNKPFYYPTYISPTPPAKVDTMEDVRRLRETYPNGMTTI